jgi:hypothetical protein
MKVANNNYNSVALLLMLLAYYPTSNKDKGHDLETFWMMSVVAKIKDPRVGSEDCERSKR